MAGFVGPGRTGPGLWSLPLLLLLLPGHNGPVSAISEAGKWILDVDSVSSANVAARASAGVLRVLRVRERPEPVGPVVEPRVGAP